MKIIAYYACRGCGKRFTEDKYVSYEKDHNINLYGIATDMKDVFVANQYPQSPGTFRAPLLTIHKCEDRIFCPADFLYVLGEND